MLDSVIRVNKKHYSETLLEEYKFTTKRLKWRTLLMMILDMMNLKMDLIMNLKMNLMTNLMKI